MSSLSCILERHVSGLRMMPTVVLEYVEAHVKLHPSAPALSYPTPIHMEW
jgi:hypothetical protein